MSSIVITDVKLASYLKKDFWIGIFFFFISMARTPSQQHLHTLGAWLCVYISITVLFCSRHTFNQHLPFQSINSNTGVGYERCSRLIKKTLARPKSIAVVHLLGLNKLYTLFECFYGRFWKASKCPVWYWQYFNADILTHFKCSQSCHCKEHVAKLLQTIWSSLF